VCASFCIEQNKYRPRLDFLLACSIRTSKQFQFACCHQHCLICRERTEASDFNAALYEHTQYLRRKKEALEMREAYESTADETGSSASSSQSGFSLKPGETITLKLAKVFAEY